MVGNRPSGWTSAAKRLVPRPDAVVILTAFRGCRIISRLHNKQRWRGICSPSG
jgi:hypothetical protein